jgi:hypothetical protein
VKLPWPDGRDRSRLALGAPVAGTGSGNRMTDVQTGTVQHRLSAEGADPLLLAGVNDSHLMELAQGMRMPGGTPG